MTEMMTVGHLGAHPTDLVAAICGAEKVTLDGFGAEPMPNSWVRPGLRFISAHESPAAAVRSRNIILRSIRTAIGLLLLVCGISVGVWWGAYTPETVTIAPIQSWSVVDVRVDGVIVRANKIDSFVKFGSELPNGERLASTAPAQRAYVTNMATTIINSEAQAASGDPK